MTLRAKNLALLRASEDIFGLNRPWMLVKQTISPAQVREFYSFIAWLWPRSTNLLDLLPSPGAALRALYIGEYAPEVIVQNVSRFGLYADEIFLINPFEIPHDLTDEFSPLIHPERWLEETLSGLYQILAMRPWIELGHVSFIPNPGDFDRSLLVKTAQAAQKRWNANPMTEAELGESRLPRRLVRNFLTLPEDYVAAKFREIEPEATDEAVEGLIAYVKKQREGNPFLTGRTSKQDGGQYLAARSGANLETGLYICQAIGGFPYTNFSYRWREILDARKQFDPTMEIWSPLTRAFQALEFKFLNNVSPEFASRMRSEERLGSFRAYLRQVWNAVDGSSESTRSETQARDFRDELGHAYAQAKKDWDQIDVDLMKWLGGSGVIASAASGFSSGRLSIALPAAGFTLNAVLQLIQANKARRHFRSTVPMSAFVDLERATR